MRIAFLAYIQNGDDMLPGTRSFAATASSAGVAFVHQDSKGTPTAATLQMLRDDIGRARQEADVVAVSYHWGRERQLQPTTFQRQLAYRTIEAGADLIVGHHTHCLQGIELYRGKPIFYSLGNFVFRSWDARTRRTGIVYLTVGKEGVRRVVFHPAWIRRVRPYLSSGQTATRTARHLIGLSRRLGTAVTMAKQNGQPVALLQLHPAKHVQTPRTASTLSTSPAKSTLAFKQTKPSPSAADFVEIKRVVPNVRIELRYATSNNFLRIKLYKSDRAFLRWSTAQKLKRAQSYLHRYGLRLKVWDAYRPRGVQQQMWGKVRDGRYVAPPQTGSDHNRGAAVDVTLVDRQGRALKMPTGYDDFSRRAHISFAHPSRQVRLNRYRLQNAMKRAGFRPLSTEWWHFSDPDARRYPIESISLKQLAARQDAKL